MSEFIPEIEIWLRCRIARFKLAPTGGLHVGMQPHMPTFLVLHMDSIEYENEVCGCQEC